MCETIEKVKCPNCDAEVYSFEVISYYLNGKLHFACPWCNGK